MTTGADLAYAALRELNVQHVFGIVSVHNIPIYDAILRHGGIQTIDMRHEQGALHAADGYARATGRLGVAITSTGPGACNAVPGLYEAQFASSPVLMLTGQVDTPYLGKGKGFLHEAERQLDMLRCVTRSAERVRHAADISETIVRLGRDALSGRPQPTAVEIPIDLQYASVSPPQPAANGVARALPQPTDVARAVELINQSRRRVIWAGGGVVAADATHELVRLAEALQAPVFTTGNGRGAISEDHPLAMGPLAVITELRDVMTNADLVIAIGTRFQGGNTANWTLPLKGKLLHIDIDPGMISRNYPATVGINADAQRTLESVNASLNAEVGDAAFLADAQARRTAARAAIRKQMGPDHERVMDAIRRHLPDEGRIVRDATVPAYIWANRLLPIVAPRTSMNSTSAAIGPGLPLAVGAAVGTGEPTVVIQGDGGFMLSIAELATAAQYALPIIVCLFNDRGYGVLRAIQRMRFDGRNTGVDLHTPDFVKVAEGMGVRAERVSGIEAFEPAFARSLSHK